MSLLALLAPGVVHDVGGICIYVVPPDARRRRIPLADLASAGGPRGLRILIDARAVPRAPALAAATGHKVAILRSSPPVRAQAGDVRVFATEEEALHWLAAPT